MLIDRHRELGSGVRRGHKELVETCDRLYAGLEAHVDFTKSYSDHIDHLWYDKSKAEVEKLLRAMAMHANGSNSNDPLRMASDAEENSFFENYPAACGILIHSFLTQAHLFGIESAGTQERVMFSCHLYNAGLQQQLLSPRYKWADLEYIIKQQGVFNIFVRERPRGLEGCFKRLSLFAGERPSETARRIRQKRSTSSNMPRTHASTRFLSIFSTLVQQYYRHEGMSRLRLGSGNSTSL